MAVQFSYLTSFSLCCLIVFKKNKRNLSELGVTWNKSAESFKDGVIFAVPVLLIELGLKYGLTLYPGSVCYGKTVFDFENFLDPSIVFSLIGYSLLCYLQEFVTRGSLQTLLERFFSCLSLSPFWAILVANSCFAFFYLHFSFMFALLAFIPGFLWGYIYLRTRNLIGVTLSHIIISRDRTCDR